MFIFNSIDHINVLSQCFEFKALIKTLKKTILGLNIHFNGISSPCLDLYEDIHVHRADSSRKAGQQMADFEY